jgi:hypothetical protein
MKTRNILSLIIAFFGLLVAPKVYGHTDPCPTGNGKATLIEYRVNGKLVDDLFAVTPGSQVSVTFTIAGTQATEFSLVSYKMPEPADLMTPEITPQMEVYQKSTKKGNPGARITLTVRVPDCLYRLYFLKGCVISQYDATCDNTYEHWNRVVEVVEGGDHHCKPKPVKKVLICYVNPATGEESNIEVSEEAAEIHYQNGSYPGECRGDSHPPVDTSCVCDYDHDGNPDRVYGAVYTSVDGSYAVKYSGESDSAVVMSQELNIDYVVVYYEDGTTESFANVGSKTKVIASPGPDIIAIEVNGNFIENLHKIDPDLTCDCFTDEPGEPVPVKLTKFTATKTAPDVVLLEWSTAQEENSDYISIEKSVDINSWEEVCRVATSGTSRTPKDYSCVDNRAGVSGNNIVYYRPKEVDVNGTYEYFNTIRIRLENAAYATQIDNAYPNPAKDRIYIRYNTAENGLFKIRLMSLEGKVLLTNEFAGKPGSQVVDLDLPESKLKPGFYLLEVQNEDQVFRQKVYKQ